MTIEIQVNHEVLANWVFVGKEVASEELADDDFISPVDALLIGEDAAMDERNLESGKIAGVSKAAAGDLHLTGRHRRVFGNGDDVVATVSLARNDID
jgi:hypothetical protein